MKILFLIITMLAFNMPGFSQKRLAETRTKEELLNAEYCTGLFTTQHADYFEMLNANAKA